MTQVLDPFAYWSRAFSAWGMMATTVAKTVTTVSASAEVIQAREPIIREAVASPLTADYAELSRMVTEKLFSFSASGTVIGRAFWQTQLEWAALLHQSVSASPSWGHPRMSRSMDFWASVASLMLKSLETSARAGRDALAPVQQAATANARRLRPVAAS